MNKIRKWLIHVLGGVTKEESLFPKTPEFHVKKYKIETLKAAYEFRTEEEILHFGSQIREKLTRSVLESIKPEIEIEGNRMVATIMIAENYIKKEQEI